MPKLVNVQETPQPKPNALLFEDPRPSRQGAELGLLAFTWRGKEEEIDQICGGGFLGNWYDVSAHKMELTAPVDDQLHSFTNVESAFLALKYWKVAESFSWTPAKTAWQKNRKLKGGEDITYGGYGSAWKAMRAVLIAKFSDQRLQSALRETGDAFLLYHFPMQGEEQVWSNSGDGTGSNLLGLLLMLVRDMFSGRDSWTEFLSSLLNTETGHPHDARSSRRLQEIAVKATIVALEALEKEDPPKVADVPVCTVLGCGQPSWGGIHGGPCAAHRDAEALALRAVADAEESSPRMLADTPLRGRLAERPASGLSLPGQVRGVSPENSLERRGVGTASMQSRGVFSTSLVEVERDMQSMQRLVAKRTMSTLPVSVSSKSMARGETGSSFYEEDEEGVVNINRAGVLPLLAFAILWTAVAGATLLMIYITYIWGEVQHLEQGALMAAVARARFAALEALMPVESAVRVVDTALASGVSLTDYAALERLLMPHMTEIVEVQIAGEEGSVHAALVGGKLRLRTDRSDCGVIEGGLGCVLGELRANETRWYSAGRGWHGPEFTFDDDVPMPCEQWCWRTSYSFVQAVGTMVLRVGADVAALQSIVSVAETLSKGEAVVCTAAGVVLALRTPEETVMIERNTGVVRRRMVWELERDWALYTDRSFVERARPADFSNHVGKEVSIWRLGGREVGSALELQESLRLVLAVPRGSFYDKVLGPLLPLLMTVAAAPPAVLLLAVAVAACMKCSRLLRRRSISPLAFS